jgi:hypothetical protein
MGREPLVASGPGGGDLEFEYKMDACPVRSGSQSLQRSSSLPCLDYLLLDYVTREPIL